MNLPLLVKKRSYMDTNIIKNVTFEDIYRCLEVKEAQTMLIDSYAEDEIHKHI